MNRRTHRLGGRIDRRTLLRGFGAGALMAPFAWAPRARAQAGDMNLIVFHWPEGLEREHWRPTVTGPQEDQFQLGPTLKALEPFRKKMVFVYGMKAGIKNTVNAHSEGPFSIWTGANPNGASIPSHPSIDQVVADAIGALTPYKSLAFGVQTNVTSSISQPYTFFADGGKGKQAIPVPAEDDPQKMYNQIFGSLAGSANAAELARLRMERKSVLDFVTGQIGRVKTRVAAADVVKLEKHFDGVRAIETSMDRLANLTCSAPNTKPPMIAAMQDANFPAVCKLQIDLMVAAIRCQVTKVATIQLTNTDSQTKIPGVNDTLGIHSTVHTRPTADKLGINRFFMSQLAYLLEQLESVTDSQTGQTLLDNTIVLAGSEMAVGNHQNSPIPLFVAGGGGVIKMGRFIDVSNTQPRHTKLLTSVAHAMGLGTLNSFGEFTDSDATGPLSQLGAS